MVWFNTFAKARAGSNEWLAVLVGHLGICRESSPLDDIYISSGILTYSSPR
jgi:hypothetical protein